MHNQKRALIISITAAVFIGIAWFATTMGDRTYGKLVTGSAKETFSGTITAYSTGCFADGICSVTVDDKKVIITAGFRISPPPVGKLLGVDSIGDLENKIGWHANVYATTTPEGDYTLYGSENYYIEVLDIN